MKLTPPFTKFLLTLCLLGSGFGLAQPLLTSYEDATAALRSSVSAFATDQVASLDALRKAEAAFGPLGAVLEPSLRQGLNETFSRAEEAIVNQSETDLQVQTAVLQGGFGRAVYQQALKNAVGGDLAAAKTLLNVLAKDLGFTDRQFSGSSQAALQGAFEARLAARGLEQLSTFGGTLGNRYRALAQLYSYVFLIQDSPRLPAKTRDTVVGTIRALVAGQPTDAGISLLKAQLTGLARSAERAAGGAVGQTAVQGSSPGAAGDQTANPAAAKTPFVPQVTPQTPPPTDAAQPTFPGTAPGALNPGVANSVASSTPGSAANPAANTANAPANPVAQTPAPAPSSAQSSDVTSLIPALPFLTPDVLTLLVLAAGLLALLGLIRLIFTPSLAPWRDAALALLLLPAVAEGLIALAGFLAPRLTQPQLSGVLTGARAYSLFINPLTQLVWVLLTVAAAFCLAASRPATRRAVTEADKTLQTERDPRSAAPSHPAPQPPRSAPLTTGTLNWDEDF